MTQDYDQLAARVQATPEWQAPAAWALGLARYAGTAPDAALLDVYFPVVHGDEDPAGAAVWSSLAGPGCRRLEPQQLQEATRLLVHAAEADQARPGVLALRVLTEALAQERDPLLAVQAPVLAWIADLAAPPADALDAWLRLHLLSHRKVRPHGQNLDGIFGLLTNVAWTDKGPIEARMVDCLRARWRARGHDLQVRSVDKFPRMTDYVVPSGVRIADADRVRLGAHLAEGTTIMHEGFVNFNAGTLGTSMVEGRISSGVVVGTGSDIGGGASIMGTLSGGGKEVVRIGERSLLGANAGLGISLGDDCIVESGLYLTAGSKVTLLPDNTIIKARELNGAHGILYRRNSQSGAIEAVRRALGQQGVALNASLHAN